MKDLKIEYRDGKLVEFSIDGIQYNPVTAITFNHEVGETLPTVSMKILLGVGQSLVPACISCEYPHIIEK